MASIGQVVAKGAKETAKKTAKEVDKLVPYNPKEGLVPYDPKRDFNFKQADLVRDKVYTNFFDVVGGEAGIDDVLDSMDSFTPEMQRLLKSLDEDNWLGYDYPEQALDEVFGGEQTNTLSQKTKLAITNLMDKSNEPKSLTPAQVEAERQKRGEQYSLEGFHGSTHADIEEFKVNRSNKGNDLGAGTYITTSYRDADGNYATPKGADIQQRIWDKQDEYLDDLEVMTEEAIYEMGEDLGVPFWQVRTYMDDPDYLAEIFATAKMTGDSQGVIYPVKVDPTDLAVIGGDSPTLHKWDDPEEAYQEIKDALFAKYLDMGDPDDVDVATLIATEVYHEVEMTGSFDITELDRLIRQELPTLTDPDTYDMVGAGSVTQSVLTELGYKGAVDKTVNKKFGTERRHGKPMEGVDEDTAHIVVFPDHENIIRSKFAQFKDPLSKNISAGIMVALGAEALEEEDAMAKQGVTKYGGRDAIKRVEAREGKLTPVQKYVVHHEGFVDGVYKDSKGIATSGVGQTGKYANMTFKQSFAEFEKMTRTYIPKYDQLPEYVQAALMSAAYRGDLKMSPTFRTLFNAGHYAQAAKEFLNHDEFRNRKTPIGIRRRLADVANAVARYGAEVRTAQRKKNNNFNNWTPYVPSKP